MKTKLVIATIAAICLINLSAYAEDAKVSAEKAAMPSQFDKMDTNKNGKISKDEWIAYNTQQFAEICKDGDAEITRGEWDEYQSSKEGRH